MYSTFTEGQNFESKTRVEIKKDYLRVVTLTTQFARHVKIPTSTEHGLTGVPFTAGKNKGGLHIPSLLEGCEKGFNLE